jgi:hypothetical protein
MALSDGTVPVIEVAVLMVRERIVDIEASMAGNVVKAGTTKLSE